ncbi:MAG: zinc ABC transporter substrate-binding protein [Bacillota bacterium]|jgi:zinc transport system substrate-binding protein/iron/zinc/copper transport system substrate-binding protein|nr:ABC transporter substrate-binding protein [Bacillota bacterium]HOB90881.1 zinc ABC transporter substrate-binding protein [Bacillota bacterium]HPZ54943.1 zinc ABC transporter substrate-binding protein [Bacillota bacterium]HQD18014.1 zinc ABC transporter substrate-binding protein [Bacillota bacterium]
MIDKRRMRYIITAILVVVLGLSLTLCTSATEHGEPREVVASTSWTAAIARAAGATNITVLAPAELRHPPEYDFKASDIAKIADTALLVWAGYEPFIQRLVTATEVPEERIIKVNTSNDPDNLIAQARSLAERLKTTDAQAEWEVRFEELVAKIKSNAEASSLSETRVLVHYHQQPFVRWLGYEVIGVFGPDEPSPVKIAELASLNPDLVIDNYHTPIGQAIADIAECPRVELRNFPASEADTLEVLLAGNARELGLL